MCEPVRKIPFQAGDKFLHFFRYVFALYGSQNVLVLVVLLEKLSQCTQLFFVFLPLDPAGFIFYCEQVVTVFFYVVELDSAFSGFIYARLLCIAVLAVTKESIATALEYPAALMIWDLVAVSVIFVWHGWPHPPVCETCWSKGSVRWHLRSGRRFFVELLLVISCIFTEDCSHF